MIKEKFNVRNKLKSKSPRKHNEYELKFNYMYSSENMISQISDLKLPAMSPTSGE